MNPTIKANSLIILKKVIVSSKLARKDLIVFQSPLKKNFILLKRIIACPGDKIEITSKGSIGINEHLILNEKESQIDWIEHEWHLNDDEFIVLGDNRSESQDSRDFGPIKFDNIIGKAILLLWPIKFLR